MLPISVVCTVHVQSTIYKNNVMKNASLVFAVAVSAPVVQAFFSNQVQRATESICLRNVNGNRNKASTCTNLSFVCLSASLSQLPEGISPFERAVSKNMDVQGDIRKRALKAIETAKEDDVKLMEIEFPPLIGGDKSKSQFDDFDNVQELEQNQNWCIQLLPKLEANKPIWFILPDLKECELAKQEWTGSRYREAATWTTIEAVTEHYATSGGKKDASYSKPWGATLASSVNSLMGGEKGDAGLLGDTNAMDDLSETAPNLHVVCQPGNGGPVEDWINVEAFHNNASSNGVSTIVVNGALDKVRDGYYPGIFFPKLAATSDRFYKQFESVFYLKPISDKGLYGWLYRVYPEQWQVVLQVLKTKNNDSKYIEDVVVYSSDE